MWVRFLLSILVGSGGLAALEQSGLLSDFSELAVIALAIVGLLIKLGLFRWELRNIQKCNWLISRAARLEGEMFKGRSTQYLGMESEGNRAAEKMKEIRLSSMWDLPWGKTQSEKLIYTAAVLAWAVPMSIALMSLIGRLSNGS